MPAKGVGKILKSCVDCGCQFAVYYSLRLERSRCQSCRGPNRYGKRPPPVVTRNCADCGAAVSVPAPRAAKTKHSFCGRRCQHAFQRTIRGSLHPQWTGGGAAKRARADADPAKRLRRRFSNQVWWALKGRKSFRRWESLVGYSLDELRAHLERQFVSGMTWENYGKWHIDHIVPVIAFEFVAADDEGFRACFALPNLRPLWGDQNIRKGAKRLTLL